jgi:CheY-like chemotaxis protein
VARILIVDDDTEQLMLSQALLEGAGHTVSTALSSAAALAWLGEVDLVVMDLGLPTASEGLALICAIRDRATIPIVVLSGWPADLYGQPEEHLVSRIMVKPVPIAELLAAILELV